MIWVTLPVYNEEHTAGVLLWRIRQLFGEVNRDFRILALDDASDDGTVEVLEPYARVMPLTLLRNQQREGRGRSLERLVREAVKRSRYPKRDGLLMMQADFTDGPEAIPEMLRHFQGGADLVVARPADVDQAPRSVRAARAGAGFLVKGLPIPEGVEDPLTGYRLYRLIVLKRALDSLETGAPLIRHDGWAANVELLSAVAPFVRRCEQVDVSVDYTRRYRASRFRPLPELWSVFRASRAARSEFEDEQSADEGPNSRTVGGG
ncbi:MAG: glycosyltransferase family 2 protein [Gemmatimonadetes bacterium]|nr:glycosyltransferase family 2 protein [Gemmatimonadota bacterium]